MPHPASVVERRAVGPESKPFSAHGVEVGEEHPVHGVEWSSRSFHVSNCALHLTPVVERRAVGPETKRVERAQRVETARGNAMLPSSLWAGSSSA